MGLKPTPRQATIVQERVREAVESGRLPADEQQIMEDFDTSLEHYLHDQ